MLRTSEVVPFVTVSDGDRAVEFYVGVLDLVLEERTPFALVLRTPNATLRVAIAESFTPAPHTVVGWLVDDIAAAVDGLAARGVQFKRYESLDQDLRGIWHSPSGARIAWFGDSDGNVLSLTEL